MTDHFDYYSFFMNAKAVGLMVLGWFIPGMGHIAQKKTARGLTFLVAIAAMTALGVIMGGKVYAFQTENPLTILAFFSDLGNGFFYILARLLAWAPGELERATFEYGTAYIAGAGLLNFLIALDAFDIAMGKKK